MRDTLARFTSESLFDASLALLDKLNIQINSETAETIPFEELYDAPIPNYLADALKSISATYFVGIINDKSLANQPDDDDLSSVAKMVQRGDKYDGMFVFACEAIPGASMTRTIASQLTRAFNRIASANPVILFIRQGNLLTLASCERTNYSQEWRQTSGEKLGKVSILRNINCTQTHRGHIDILEALGDKAYPTFNELYKHWLEVFSNELLTKKFYSELSDWYAWAVQVASFPNDLRTNEDDAKFNHESCIRLITRLIFVWFLKEKKLIPEEFFDEVYIRENLIKEFDPHARETLFYNAEQSKYYRLILQNLFFAMLNCPIVAEGKDTPNNRRFRKPVTGRLNGDYNVNNLMRYENDFMEGGAKKFVKLANSSVPFLNGGLFDCLDDKPRLMYYDGFSERRESLEQLYLPDYLFFGEEVGARIDLSQWYGDSRKKAVSARGLIDILKKYSFTIEENTPLDQEVSLDPELLGKVFENLLASFNPETQTSARKQTGSFYTPREIVQYMVDESLVAHLKRICGEELEQKYRNLVSYSVEDVDLSKEDRSAIMKAIYNCRVLDPACGSGAFPMGVLQQMVHILRQIDPDNEMWNEMMLDIATEETKREMKRAMGNASEMAKISANHEERIKDIYRAFDQSINDPDYARKLYLIEHCIYGVDIQPIATQISKLRFFISLVVDQKPTKEAKDNFGIRPLPNLEAKFVTANTLIPLDRTKDLFSSCDEVRNYEEQLQELNHRIFLSKRNKDKEALREAILDTQRRMAQVMENLGLIGSTGVNQIAAWKMFDQNASAPFFDPEWMFGVKDGFDVVIANPPYKIIPREDKLKEKYDFLYKVAHGGKRNLYHLFFEKGINCMVKEGTLSYITPDTYFSGNDTVALRQFLLSNVGIHRIIHYTEKDKVFENVTQAVAVITCSKGTSTPTFDIVDHDVLSVIDLKNLKSDNKFVFKAINPIISKIKEQKETFGTVCEGYKGDVNLGNKKEYFVDFEDDDTLPLVRGIQITKYCYSSGTEYCYKKALSRDHTKKERIVFQEVANMGLAHRVKGTLLSNVILGDSTNYIFSTRKDIDNYYMLAILNSKVVNYYFKYFNQTNHVPIGELKQIPFACANSDVQSHIVELAKLMIKNGKNGCYDKDTESEIDHLVYHLYGLTFDDVLIIDPETPITREEYENFKCE